MAYSLRSPLSSLWIVSGSLALSGLSGCKPAGEAPRLTNTGEVSQLQTWLSKGGTIRRSGAQASPPIVYPDVNAPLEGFDPDVLEGDSDQTDLGEVTPEEALLASLSAQPSPEALEQARALNKSGSDALRKLDFERAIRDFKAALELYPGYPFARYNLAEALTLAKRPEEALTEIEVLALLAQSDQTARDRLVAARIDTDFESVRHELRFRQATLATDILISWYPSTSEQAQTELRALNKRLREGRWLSQISTTPWTEFEAIAGLYLLVQQHSDEVTLKAADQIANLLRDQGLTLSLHRDVALPEDSAPLVLLWVDEAPAVALNPAGVEGADEDSAEGLPLDPLAPPETESIPSGQPSQVELGEVPDADRFARFYEHPLLRQNDNGSSERIELRTSGFFTWTLAHAGTEIRRSGRFNYENGSLNLDYRERKTELSGDIREENNLKRSIKVHLPAKGSAESLIFDGQLYESEP